ncbi:MAG: coproporphyrinogen-III oxidase family protein [bacterium]
MGLIDDAGSRMQLLDVGELHAAGLIPKGSLYYPTIYYPPIPMYGGSDEARILDGLVYDESRPAAVYIHIPFCRSRCLYCHWMVNVDSTEKEIDDYLDCLAAEMALWKEKFGARAIRPRSVLVGGGTPTALTPKQTGRLFRDLRAGLDFGDCTQITCETEPGSLLGKQGLDKLKVLKDNGVDRVSLGVQAFDDASLKDMGRRHSAADVAKAMERIREVGFRSLSVDLIYGYPGCTPEKWLTTLKTALSLGVDAFQLYRLRIVPHGDKVGTIKTRFDASPEIFPSVEDIYIMKQLGSLVAGQGGLRETSRRLFTKGPAHTSHYLADHTDRLCDVIGFGASSWSNVQGRFYLNTGESLAAYAAFLRDGSLPINRGKIRTADDERRWAVAVTLKHNGLPKKRFRELTGVTVNEAFPRQIETLKKYGLVKEDDATLQLTVRGKFFADEVVTQFYHPKYLPFPQAAYAEGDLNPFSYDPS